jgi:hypothetical protein
LIGLSGLFGFIGIATLLEAMHRVKHRS